MFYEFTVIDHEDRRTRKTINLKQITHLSGNPSPPTWVQLSCGRTLALDISYADMKELLNRKYPT